MKRLIVLTALLMLIGCANQPDRARFLVLDYSDFGPQAMAYELLGPEWWQWQPHGDSTPRHYNVQVVVHPQPSLDDARESYPVIEADNQDFRYISCSDAMDYLDEHIAKDILEAVTARLIETRSLIEERFGKGC